MVQHRHAVQPDLPHLLHRIFPRNDRLAYLTRDDVRGYLDEIAREHLPTRLIGFTGGEPFMNPDIIGDVG